MCLSTLACIMALALGLLVVPRTTEAQPLAKIPRLGYLTDSARRAESEALRQALREIGYVEGQTIAFEWRFVEQPEQYPDRAAELVRLKVDVIVAGGAPAIRAAQHATRTIPIVMAGTSDPVGAGFVASLAHPGGNITGLSDLGAELLGKRLEILKETVPQSARIAVLANPAPPYYEPLMNSLTVAARALGLQLHVVELHRADELDTAFAAMTRAGADALIVLSNPALPTGSMRGRIAELAATHRLPAMYGWKHYVDAGGLMSYGPSPLDTNRRAATYVDKILKGAKPADLPVEQPTKFELIINLKTAKSLGLTIPPSVLFQADEVIK